MVGEPRKEVLQVDVTNKQRELDEVFRRLGKLLTYATLMSGGVEPDKIVRYAEEMANDPEGLYLYVREQLNALIQLANKALPEVLERNSENTNLFSGGTYVSSRYDGGFCVANWDSVPHSRRGV